ncbi:alpha/beta fold hydrolase [Aestuariibacter salexigens]|uniref:alpha/beta fold hydrolase n=1 Tax=Aestuariibacter salexigens TaxID=226010 RepID=UPI00041829D5|nr:alpha/beta hydrolase [Aestuariibacter salexigens]
MINWRILPCFCALLLFAGNSVALTEIKVEIGKFTVDDYNLSYTCAGQGAPNVFLEPPSGLRAEDAFAKIFLDVARTNKICFYERLGFADSDDVPEGLNQTAKDYSHELHELIKLKADSQKLVLVGYSFGGLVMRYYAAQHPERVASMLLIDAAHEDWIQDMKKAMSPDDWQKMQGILDWFQDNLGHNYWDSQFDVSGTKLPEDLEIRIISRGLPHETIRQAGVSEQGIRIYNELHDKYQDEQLKLSSNTQRVFAKKSTHLLVDSEPHVVMEQLSGLLN